MVENEIVKIILNYYYLEILSCQLTFNWRLSTYDIENISLRIVTFPSRFVESKFICEK
jgi:hypothetical protein